MTLPEGKAGLAAREKDDELSYSKRMRACYMP